MWLDLQKPATYAHNGKERFSSPIDSSINKLMITTPLPKVDWSAYSEVCFWGQLDAHECSGVHWMPLVSLYRQPPCLKSPPDSLMMLTMDLSISCDILSAMWHYSGPFHPWALLYPTTSWLPPYTSSSVVLIKNLKWQEIQLIVHCGVGGLIAIK